MDLVLKWTRCNCFRFLFYGYDRLSCVMWSNIEYPDCVAPIHLHNSENGQEEKLHIYPNGAKSEQISFSFCELIIIWRICRWRWKEKTYQWAIILACPFLYLLSQLTIFDAKPSIIINCRPAGYIFRFCNRRPTSVLQTHFYIKCELCVIFAPFAVHT